MHSFHCDGAAVNAVPAAGRTAARAATAAFLAVVAAGGAAVATCWI